MSIATEFKKSLSEQLIKALKREKVSQSELARRMGTSRAVVHRMLKASDPSITLLTIERAVQALGRQVVVRIVKKG